MNTDSLAANQTVEDQPATVARNRGTDLRRLVLPLTVGTNLLGATVTFFYFAFVESGLRPPGQAIEIKHSLALFVVIVGLVTAGISVTTARLVRRARSQLKQSRGADDPRYAVAAVGSLLNLPAQMAAFSLLGWLAAGIIYACLHEFLPGGFIFPPGKTVRSFVGIVFVGAPFTVLFVYFGLEYTLRQQIRLLFPREVLAAVPGSFRVNVLPKLLVVSLMIGTIPISVVSYITISQICEIHDGYQSIASFVSHVPVVIGFLLSFAVVVALGLTAFVAFSVSEPLRQAARAMERIREGDLDASIPVVSNDEIGFMAEGFNRMVEGLKERDAIRETFGCYLSREVVEEILKSPDGVNLGGELREVTILVSDLRGFTALTASLPPEVVVRVLNRYLQRMVDIIFHFNGIVDEFIGDGILAFFGAPRPIRESQRQAVLCGLEMQRSMPALNQELLQCIPELRQVADHRPGEIDEASSLERPLSMGIAVNSGRLVVGNIGSDKRKKYGAVGTPINVAFRVERETRGGDILITPDVYERVADLVETQLVPDVALKGIEETLVLHRVVGLMRV